MPLLEQHALHDTSQLLHVLRIGHTPGLRLLGISTIGGNQTLAKVTQNALDVLDAVGLSHIGAHVPTFPHPSRGC